MKERVTIRVDKTQIAPCLASQTDAARACNATAGDWWIYGTPIIEAVT